MKFRRKKSTQKITSKVSWKDFDEYEKLKNRLKEERRLLKILEKQSAEKLSEEIVEKRIQRHRRPCGKNIHILLPLY